MTIITGYKLERNIDGEFFCECGESAQICPNCGGDLKYRDSCRRKFLLEGHESHTCIIRRLKCTNCGRLHRELPDMLAPYKQYTTEIISGVLDEVVTPQDAESEDYPCLSTIYKWILWLALNKLVIDGYLKSIGSRLPGFSEKLLMSGESLLEQLRKSNTCWLEIILRFIYNSGGFLEPFRGKAFAPTLL